MSEYASRASPAALTSSHDSAHGFTRDDISADRLRAATFYVVVAGMVVAALVAIASGVRVTARDAGQPAWTAAALLLASLMLLQIRGKSRFADAVGTVGLGWLASITGAAISLAGLHLRFPIADSWLFAADRAIGFDGVAAVAGLIREGQWIFSVMAPAYVYTFHAVALSILLLVLVGNRLEAWRAAFCFSGCVLSSCFISAFTPAKGLGVWLAEEIMSHLPQQAVNYAFESFDRFYFDPSPELGMDALQGTVTFPSVHLIMGLIVLAMWRKNAVMFAVATVWFCFMVLSTFAFGGHYAVDLLGGWAMWAGWFALSRHLERRPVSRDAQTDTATAELLSATPAGDDRIAA